MNKLYNLSICVTDLANLPDDAVKKASNGKSYLNCSLWINDAPDDNGVIGKATYDQKNDEGKYDKTNIASVRIIKKKDDESKTWKEHLAR